MQFLAIPLTAPGINGILYVTQGKGVKPMTHTFFDTNELQERIRLNREHLKQDPYYHTAQLFPPMDYDWYGDKEGRAPLAKSAVRISSG